MPATDGPRPEPRSSPAPITAFSTLMPRVLTLTLLGNWRTRPRRASADHLRTRPASGVPRHHRCDRASRGRSDVQDRERPPVLDAHRPHRGKGRDVMSDRPTPRNDRHDCTTPKVLAVGAGAGWRRPAHLDRPRPGLSRPVTAGRRMIGIGRCRGSACTTPNSTPAIPQPRRGPVRRVRGRRGPEGPAGHRRARRSEPSPAVPATAAREPRFLTHGGGARA
jgi:hypothetical protein